MAKKTSKLKYVRAKVDSDGNLHARYHWKDNPTPGSEAHDEDVSKWTDDEIKRTVRSLVGIDADDPIDIELERE